MEEEERRQGWISLLLPAGTFLVGLALGGILVYAGTSGGSDAESVPSESTSSGSPSGGADTVVTVPAACDEAAAKVSEAYTLLRQAVSQVRDFQADQLVETLNQLEDVDGQTRPLVDECTAVSVTTSPTAEPTTD